MDVDTGGGVARGSSAEHSAPPRIPTTPQGPPRMRPSPVSPLGHAESFVQPTVHELADAFIRRKFDQCDCDGDKLLNSTKFRHAIQSLGVRNKHFSAHELYIETCYTHAQNPIHGMDYSTFAHLLWADNGRLGVYDPSNCRFIRT